MQDATNDQAESHEAMTETKLQEILAQLAFEGGEDGEALLPGAEHSGTFEDMGIMTRNKGVVIRFEDGSEFQVTIVRSR